MKRNSTAAVNLRIQPARQCKVTRDPGCRVVSVYGACSEVVRSRQQGLVCRTSTRPFRRTLMNQAEYRLHNREGTLDAWKCPHCEAVAARPKDP